MGLEGRRDLLMSTKFDKALQEAEDALLTREQAIITLGKLRAQLESANTTIIAREQHFQKTLKELGDLFQRHVTLSRQHIVEGRTLLENSLECLYDSNLTSIKHIENITDYIARVKDIAKVT